MWTRAELKSRAKGSLKKYFWAAFVVSLICGMLNGFGGGTGFGGSLGRGSSKNESGQTQDFYTVPEAGGENARFPFGTDEMAQGDFDPFSSLYLGIFLTVFLAVFVVMLVLSIFVGPVIEVGKNRFYMESRSLGGSAGIGKVAWGFSGHYLKIVKNMFVKNLIVSALPSILIIVVTAITFVPIALSGEFGGIAVVASSVIVFFAVLFLSVAWSVYFSYCYLMAPYILSENPEMRARDVLKLSREMMSGHKFNTWVLGLSFLGWMILGVLACCVGTFFVQPYFDATYAELYAVLRQPYGDKLAGFGVPDVIPAGGDYGTYVNQPGDFNGYGGYGDGNFSGGANDGNGNGGTPNRQ